MMKKLLRDAVIGAVTAVSSAPKVLERVKESVEYERHELEESVQLLNAMRRVGGVRTVEDVVTFGGVKFHGLPKGQISENVMRHTDFNHINELIETEGVEFEGYGPMRVFPEEGLKDRSAGSPSEPLPAHRLDLSRPMPSSLRPFAPSLEPRPSMLLNVPRTVVQEGDSKRLLTLQEELDAERSSL